MEEDGRDERLVQFELACTADGVLRQVLFNLAIAAKSEVSLMRIRAKQMPSLLRVAPMYLKLVISTTFRPFKLICALLLFCVLNSIPFATALSTNTLLSLFAIAAAHRIDVVGESEVAWVCQQ